MVLGFFCYVCGVRNLITITSALDQRKPCVDYAYYYYCCRCEPIKKSDIVIVTRMVNDNVYKEINKVLLICTVDVYNNKSYITIKCSSRPLPFQLGGF